MVKDVTYHNYQQILDFQNPEVAVLKQRKARKKFKKSMDGCLCCKKRRKKCDETKPICQGCARNRLTCEWPNHVDLKSVSVVGPVVVDTSSGIVEDNRKDLIKADDEFLLLAQFLNIQLENENIGSPLSASDSFDFEIPETLLREVEQASGNTSIMMKDEPENYTIPGIVLSHEDQLCYNQFIKKFIPSITALHSENDSSLTPYKILTPFAATHMLVRETFLACGATLLCFNNDEFHQLAHDKYVHSVNLLIQELQDSQTACEDHLFVSVQILQTLCLRDKNIGLNATKSASHLSAAYEILTKRRTEVQGLSILDRVLTEHFVFNYPITIMLCRHNKLASNSVPSPFKFFEEFDEFLTAPIINNDSNDPWSNHPMLGMTLKALELSAKCTWVCRLLKQPISKQDLLLSSDLMKQCQQELELLNQVKTDDRKKLVNISFAKSILYGCLIITKKICDWSIKLEKLQLEVNNMIEEFKFCYSLYEPHEVLISIWCLCIAGSASMTVEQREYLTFGFLNIAAKINSSLTLKILKYLKIIWDEDSSTSTVDHGFEFLFDTTVLDIVCS